jgi:Ca2+-binding RTX toxin-like protein
LASEGFFVTVVLCESIESRVLLSSTLGAGGALAIVGSANADVIGLKLDGATLRVDENGTLSTFTASSVKSISIDLGDGNDRLDVGAGVGAIYCLGGLGDDTINGGDFSDTITAGGGKDSVNGNGGDDRLDGGPTSDWINGGDGADRIYGGDANDVLTGNGGVDRLFGGAGNDGLFGNSSNDKLYGDDGNDTLNGNTQNDLLTGGTGNDLLIGSDGSDTLTGGNGDDTLLGQADADTCFGDSGNDAINGGGGNDSLAGGVGDDDIAASDGDDLVDGGAGNDSVYGEFGNDFVNGGDGDDLATGGPGDDTVRGGTGNDAVFGSLGHDTLDGGDGADRYLQWGGDVISGQTSVDAVITFSDGDASWTPNEIVDLDAGFQWLVQRTGNTKMLKLSTGGPIAIVRDHDVGSDVLGENFEDGRIVIADLAYTDTSIGGPDVVVVHEIAHNWDTPDENPGIKAFYDLSQWRSRNHVWAYLNPSATFARDYGMTNPYEDFATSLEVYYSKLNPASNWQAKWNYMDSFLNSMSG